MSNEFYWIAVAVVTVVSASRITRLLTFDAFPPIRWAREKFEDKFDGTGWETIAFCPWCMSPWVTAALVLWADVAGVLDGEPAWGGDGELSQPFWWIFNGIIAGAYLAAMLMVRDGDNSGDTSGDDDEDDN